MNHAKQYVSLLIVSVMLGCATPQTPQEVVFQARSSQNVALRAAVAYRELPSCEKTMQQPCSQKAVVEQLQKSDRVSDGALAAAESAVRTPGFGANVVETAVTAANAALAALQALVSTLGVK